MSAETKIQLAKVIEGSYTAQVGIYGRVSIIRDGKEWIASGRMGEIHRDTSLSAVVEVLADTF